MGAYVPVILDVIVHCVPCGTDPAILVPGPHVARVTCSSERILKKQVLHSRRHQRRVETPEGVCAVWQCGRTEDTSRVKDLSVGGLLIETLKVCPVGANCSPSASRAGLESGSDIRHSD